jgi:hypothetical protein
MDSGIKASFIPDKMPSHQQGGGSRISGGGAGDVFVLIATVALAASLALAAGVFLYDKFLESSVAKKGEQLERARAAFEPALIEELLRLDTRLSAADDVLNLHLAPSELFNLLEELTLQSVAFETFNYQMTEDGQITIQLKGKARSVNGVALQASVFGQHNAIVNPIFSDLDIVEDGVTFSVAASINPSALRYTSVAGQYVDSSFNALPLPSENTGSAPASNADFGDFGAGGQ